MSGQGKRGKVVVSEKTMTFPQFSANFILNDYRGLCNKYGFEIDAIPPQLLRYYVERCFNGEITRYILKEIVDFLLWMKRRLS